MSSVRFDPFECEFSSHDFTTSVWLNQSISDKNKYSYPPYLIRTSTPTLQYNSWYMND